jgi:uncharacterized membrane protein
LPSGAPGEIPGMTTLDDWLVAIHILCAVIWVGGAFVTQFYGVRALSTNTDFPLGPFSRQAEFVGQRTFLPASVILLGTGIWLVARDIFQLEFWNTYGLVIIGLSIVTGAGFLGPESGRIAQLVDAKGDDDPEVISRIGRLLTVSRVELALLVSVVLVMTLKPGT